MRNVVSTSVILCSLAILTSCHKPTAPAPPLTGEITATYTLTNAPIALDISDDYIFIAEAETGITLLDTATGSQISTIQGYNSEIPFTQLAYIKYIPARNLLIISNNTHPDKKLFTATINENYHQLYDLEFSYLISGIEYNITDNYNILKLYWASQQAGNTYQVSVNEYNIVPNPFEPYIPIYSEIMPFRTRGTTSTDEYFITAMEQWGVYIVKRDETLEHIATIDTPGSAYDVAIYSKYVYVADAYRGLQVIDLSTMSLTGIERSTSGEATSIDAYNGYLALASGTGGVYIYDISNPSNPKQIKRLLFSEIGRPNMVKFYGDALYIARTTNSSITSNAILKYEY